MSQNHGNNVKPPVHEKNNILDEQEKPHDLADQHHGENTKSPQDDKKIGQSNGAGRPPLMKK